MIIRVKLCPIIVLLHIQQVDLLLDIKNKIKVLKYLSFRIKLDVREIKWKKKLNRNIFRKKQKQVCQANCINYGGNTFVHSLINYDSLIWFHLLKKLFINNIRRPIITSKKHLILLFSPHSSLGFSSNSSKFSIYFLSIFDLFQFSLKKLRFVSLMIFSQLT